MENLNVAIVTDDRNYGRACSLAILNVCRTLIINVFSKDEFATCGYKSEGTESEGRFFSGFDIVMWDGIDMYDNDGWVDIYLVEKPSMTCRATETGKYSIYKYSPANKIVADIFEIYGDVTGRRPVVVSSESAHLFACCSWKGGAGCTTTAIAVGQELVRFHNKRVLYISMEELESTGDYINCSSRGRSMSYYLYQLFKNRNEKRLIVSETDDIFVPFMESYTVKDDFGMETFRPTKGRNPLVDLNSDEICTFVQSIMASGRYDVIIVDTGNGMSQAAMTWIEMAERICLVTDEDSYQGRETQYIQYLMAVGGEDMVRKMIKVENKVSGLNYGIHAEGDDDSLLETSIRIKESNIFAEEDGICKVLLEGDYGEKISNLTNIMVEPLN